ncbi:Purkinje cell protein 4-like protein 1 [Lingula anatina]|uniref:Purkinje cell protein 4-like protein 1 n=1 Tax=Lingula anatina TaxID=7574 RepID=A0A1S3KGY6_LINAN|nr:Purkinje cell protein 4-like protein 1 [Lingula anatina]|eukprot:XP_013421752.1 Purkinje cell protein 4-like protein 1 [Lingula anatina]
MKARKQVSDMKTSAHDDANMAPSQEPASATVEEEEEEIDIDLNDPEVEKAATKIQAGFKGMKARKNVKAVKVCDFEVGCLLS